MRRATLLGLPLLWLLAGTAAAQAPEAAPDAAPEGSAAAEPAPPEAPDYSQPMGPPDPYNRGTPRGSVYGFYQATRQGDHERAAQYLDLRRLPSDERDEAPELTRQLRTVLDRQLLVDFEHLSPDEQGAAKDGLPTWQDRLGVLRDDRGEVEVLLQRVPRADDGVRIWKFAASTVEAIPELNDRFGSGLLERYLPAFFFRLRPLSVELWQWLGFFVLAFLAWLLSWIFGSALVRTLGLLASRSRSTLDDRLVHLVRNPVRLALAVLLFHVGMVALGLPLRVEEILVGLEKVLLVLAVAWLTLLLVDLATLMMQARLERGGDLSAAALLAPGKKVVRVVIVILAGLFLLDNLGYNVAALIAGLGVGGIAVALAAQKTVENLFGGVTVMIDQPVRVGDFCRFGDKVGTVEEIGLRSTRVRTLDRTLVTIPNAEFSALQLENFAARDRIRLFTVIGLRYETTNEQLRFVLARLREMLLAHPKIDPDPARVRFVGFGAYSLDLEIFAYARTSDWNEFLQIREDVFLRVMDIVEEAGSGFAFPSSTTYIGRDEGLDEARAEEATARVAEWRERAELPFPEFSERQRRAYEDTLDWPPEGSTSRRPPEPAEPAGGADER